MKNTYTELRAEFRRRGILQEDIAERLGRKIGYVNARMIGRAPWDQRDMYTILDWLGLPVSKMAYYFPPKGIAVEVQEQAASESEKALVSALRVLLGKNE